MEAKLKKSPISFLQEYCAKRYYALPKYEIIDSGDKLKPFACKAEAIKITVFGLGRSKKEAKNDSATNLINKIKSSFPDIIPLPPRPQDLPTTTDAEFILQNFSVKDESVELIKKPRSTEMRIIATIKGDVGKSKYIVAKQAPIPKQANQQNSVVSDYKNIAKSEHMLKFKAYSELTKSNITCLPQVTLANRHKYFSDFPDNLKIQGRKAIDSKSFCGSKESVMKLFQALKINPKTTLLKTKTSVNLLIDLNCEYDVVFNGQEYKIYDEILEYFKHMLE